MLLPINSFYIILLKTVLRHIHSGNIPFEKNKGEKAYRIPAEHYYQSLSNNGKSSWFQNHTRE
jgi:hypothetical protein